MTKDTLFSRDLLSAEGERRSEVMDEIVDTNQRHWERMVREGCGFTRPWLDLNPSDLQANLKAYAKGDLVALPEPLFDLYPANVLLDVAGKDVLCLASGGGQQSVVFGLLGAHVTVVDLTEGQLAGDRVAAAHYGYEVTTIQADMRDLSPLRDGTFDLVYQAPSMSYVPDVRPVYDEVARLLRAGGLYRVAFTNPATDFVDCEDWNGEGYSISHSYAARVRHRTDGPIEFRHYLSDIFNGLIAAGFSVRRVEEAPQPKGAAPPGSWAHWLTYIVSFAVVARREP